MSDSAHNDKLPELSNDGAWFSESLDAGMDDYSSKPLDPTALRRALEFWTTQRSRGTH